MNDPLPPTPNAPSPYQLPTGPGVQNSGHGTSHTPGYDPIPDLVDVRSKFYLSGLVNDLTPPQITANTDNYAPQGGDKANVWRLDLDANHDLTGISIGYAATNRTVTLVNISTHVLTLKHDVTSVAANRFYLPFSKDQILEPNGAILLHYDSISTRWRMVAYAFDYTDLLAADTSLSGRITVLEGLEEQKAYLAAGQQLTSNSVVMQTITGVKLTGAANESWRFRMTLVSISTAVANMKFQFTVPAGATLFFSTGSFVSGGVSKTFGSVNAATSVVADGAGLNVAIEIMGSIFFGATPGDMQLQAAQNVATAETIDFIVQGTNLVGTKVH